MNAQQPIGVYEYLRSRIIAGELPPHFHLKEQDLAAQLGVSRTPVREALARLEMESLVKRTPRRGAIVLPVELEEVDEIYEIRAALESLVARRACERATADEVEEMSQALERAQGCIEANDLDGMIKHTVHFHRLLNRASRSPRLVELLRSLEDRLAVLRQRGIHYPGRPESSMREHWGILEGLRQRNPAEMCRWVEAHAESGRTIAVKIHIEEARSRRMG